MPVIRLALSLAAMVPSWLLRALPWVLIVTVLPLIKPAAPVGGVFGAFEVLPTVLLSSPALDNVTLPAAWILPAWLTVCPVVVTAKSPPTAAIVPRVLSKVLAVAVRWWLAASRPSVLLMPTAAGLLDVLAVLGALMVKSLPAVARPRVLSSTLTVRARLLPAASVPSVLFRVPVLVMVSGLVPAACTVPCVLLMLAALMVVLPLLAIKPLALLSIVPTTVMLAAPVPSCVICPVRLSRLPADRVSCWARISPCWLLMSLLTAALNCPLDRMCPPLLFIMVAMIAAVPVPACSMLPPTVPIAVLLMLTA